MSVKNYRFVSPGVFVNEIDNSQVPASPAGIGPVVIGRAASGPALRPVTVRSFEEFVNIFGTPSPGGDSDDVWREGTNKSSTTYGMYAAQAYLRNSSPLTYIRLLGANHEDADTSATGNAGWSATGGAHGLVIFEESGTVTAASASVTCVSSSTSAVGSITFTGTPAVDGEVTIFDSTGASLVYTAAAATTPSAREFIRTGSPNAVALALKSCIDFHSLTDPAATVTDGIVELTAPAASGPLGNQIVTGSLGAADFVDLAGGTYTIGTILSLTGSGGDLQVIASASAAAGHVSTGANSTAFASNLAEYINANGSTPGLTATAATDKVTIRSTLAGTNSDPAASSVSSSNGTYFNVTASAIPEGPGLTGSLTGGSDTRGLDGVLAAILYSTDEATTFALSGTTADFSTVVVGNGKTTASADAITRAVGPNKEFKLVVTDYKGVSDLTTTINFTTTDSRYIRKALNTNPQLTNAATTESPVKYFLGETFDRHLSANITSNTAATTYASIVALSGGVSTYVGSDFKTQLQSARTPNIISCRLSPTYVPVNLFHIEALEQPGDWSNRNIKISIQDIRRSTNNSTDYGTFSVVVRHLSDSDNVVRIIEQFTGCDLNPLSLNYVARKIGTQTRTWDPGSRRLRHLGDWPNNSSHIRIVMSTAADGADSSLLPFGFEGILKYDNEELMTGSAAGNWISGSEKPASTIGAGPFWASGSALTASVFYPDPELRLSASDGGLSNRTDAYFGFQTTKTAGGTVFDRSTIDLVRPRGGIAGSMFGSPVTNKTDRSVNFTLDDVSGSTGIWVSGSHNLAAATTGGGSLTRINGAVSGVLDAGYDRFTVPMYGGFDGVDIKDMDAFANINIVGTDETTSYTLNTFRRAIDTIADPETVEMSLATIPGLTNEGLTTHLINTCEDRADALAIIDLPGAFTPREESTAVNRENLSSTITSLINGLRSRGLNSSYGCTYYPWVRARDTINGAFLWLPPTIPALGTLSSSQRKTQVWFAPAGFNRGGLTEGSAGIPVVDVAHQLRRQDRDDLYTANINPIAKFPAEGIVIFGQKTLQVTPSALDRINVRRLMIFIKKRISQIAAGLLFDPNVRQTWLRFTAQVNPFLADVKTNFGLSAFKVILDESTTTPDLLDRNILYAQIFLKPTRAIEFIAIDFNISRTGASFED